MPLDIHSFPTRRSSDLGASSDSSTGIPRLMQLRKKIRAKLFATIPPMPCFARAATAYSRELPHPKFSPPTSTSPGRTALANSRSEEHTSELQSPMYLVCPWIYTLSLHDALPI